MFFKTTHIYAGFSKKSEDSLGDARCHGMLLANSSRFPLPLSLPPKRSTITLYISVYIMIMIILIMSKTLEHITTECKNILRPVTINEL